MILCCQVLIILIIWFFNVLCSKQSIYWTCWNQLKLSNWFYLFWNSSDWFINLSFFHSGHFNTFAVKVILKTCTNLVRKSQYCWFQKTVQEMYEKQKFHDLFYRCCKGWRAVISVEKKLKQIFTNKYTFLFTENNHLVFSNV